MNIALKINYESRVLTEKAIKLKTFTMGSFSAFIFSTFLADILCRSAIFLLA